MSGTASVPQPIRVFLSYAHADGAQAASQLRSELERAHFSVWRDVEGMRGGKDWREQLRGAIQEVDALVLLLTPGSVASEVVIWERTMARELGKPVIPLMIQSCELPPDLKSPHYHRLDEPERYGFGLAALIGDLRQLANIVKNIIREGAKVAFVLESPHVAEVAHGYPACGETGREMSRVLLGRYDIPLGLVAKYPEICELLGLPVPYDFSIINVSQRPLQEAAYSKNGRTPPNDIAVRMKLKKLIDGGANLDTLHRDSRLRELSNSIYKDFEDYGKNVLTGYRIVIPCGHFARLFVMCLKEQQKLGFCVVDGIGHPSRGGWRRLHPDTQRILRACIGLQCT